MKRRINKRTSFYIKTELKQRILKYDFLHGLYKIPLGVLLIYVALTNMEWSGDALNIQFIIHDLSILIGARALLEGIYDAFHNPIKKEALKVIAREKYIANNFNAGSTKRR